MDKDKRLKDVFQKAVALLTLSIVILLTVSKHFADENWTPEQRNVLQPWIYPWEEVAQFCLCIFFFAVCALPTALHLIARSTGLSPPLPIVRCLLSGPFKTSLRAQRIMCVLILSILNDLWIGINIRSLCYAASDLGCSTGTRSCQVARSIQCLSIFAGCLMILEIHFSCKAFKPKAKTIEADTGNIHPGRQPVAPV
ncbi:hypothetical protein MVEG_03478 [Podila verticillata NRRL 6337]|nr:hypothetical protein MVEG_03478 [Podila verticillata NRRL 6337]